MDYPVNYSKLENLLHPSISKKLEKIDGIVLFLSNGKLSVFDDDGLIVDQFKIKDFYNR